MIYKHRLFVIFLYKGRLGVCFKALEVGKSRMGFRLYCRAGAPRDSRSYVQGAGSWDFSPYGGDAAWVRKAVAP